jgi:predicted acyl esterase
VDLGAEIRAHPLDDGYHHERSPDWSKVTVPLLSAGNWGGQGLHLRGNIEGFVRAASSEKWLEMHGLEHWTEFYTDYGVALQKRFFGCFLKGEEEGWRDQPPVQLQVRRIDGFVERAEREWPLARTRWTRFFLDGGRLSREPAASERGEGGLTTEPTSGVAAMEYDALGDGLTFATPPLDRETEITGPAAAKLFVSSSTTDADLFVVLRAFAPDGEEVVFQGALDPHTPIGQGWLRASHRRLDPELSTDYRPYHSHDAAEPLTPGEVYELDIEIWPTCVVLPAGYRIALTVRGRDYEHAGGGARLGSFKNEMRGCGPFLHEPVVGGVQTLHCGGERPSSVLLPIIP